jgi:hypothetical protein
VKRPIFVLHLRIPQRKNALRWVSFVAEHSTAMPSDTWPMNKKLAQDQREALGMLAASLRAASNRSWRPTALQSERSAA